MAKGFELKLKRRPIDPIMTGPEVAALVAGKAEEAAAIAAAIYTDSEGETTYEVLGPSPTHSDDSRQRAAVIARSPSPAQRTEARKALASAAEAVSDSFTRRNK